MNVLKRSIVISLLTASIAFGVGEKFEPTSKEQLDKFYSTPERSITVDVNQGQTLHTVPKGFLGINMSYFVTTDDMWQKFSMANKLKYSGIGSLRYPGGEETSFFHWEHPGVNGYEDLWAPKEQHGTSHGRGKFQVAYCPPEDWATNEDFMSLDDFMQECIKIGAEPILGLNLSSGKKYNRSEEGREEALRMMRYCKNKGFKVKYWFLDNEPWNGEANYRFKGDEYLDEIVYYGKEIKKEFPEAKLIINPTGDGGYKNRGFLEKVVRKTGDYIDYIDFHWYWGWGVNSFEAWLKDTPMTTISKWNRNAIPYGQAIKKVKKICADLGYPEIGVVVLEWNLGPSDHSQAFKQSAIAIMQGEILLEYMLADVHLTCLWPFLWQSSRDVWSEQDFFPSIITQDEPYNPTLSLDMYRLLSPLQTSTLVTAASPQKDTVVVSAKTTKGEMLVYVINKNVLRRRVTVNFEQEIPQKATAEMIGLKHQLCLPEEIDKVEKNMIQFYAEPYSLTAIKLQ